ncbi:hypothetical protein HDV05_007526 [Chytridiales sp. JEL 0842]|nr:hypothetical protein HDV05_007526 [Chytridiales sp. JEL 0842]
MAAETVGITLPFLLPPPPANWDKEKDFKLHKRLAPPKKGQIEPVGREFLGVLRRKRYNRTLSQDWELEAALKSAEDGDLNMEEDEPETKKLLASDPNKWKDQDHYAVLGISKLRYKANDEDLKRAYRRKVLKHHPDKKAGATGKLNDDSFFKCIQKAYEVLSDPVKRRQWDSVDPEFDESLPGSKYKGDFFEVFGAAFDKESRFSKTPSMPPFGNIDSTREEVETFYDAWFNFESWRSFEMMDEEEEGLGDSREEKRWLEKKNRNQRAKLKKEDNGRITRFVELAMKLDPRIARIKEEEKAAKEAKKKEKEMASKQAEIDAARKAEEERLQKEKEEKEEKERREVEKKEKEAAKKALRKAKKEIKNLFAAHNNFLPAKSSLSAIEEQNTKFDLLLEGSELWHLEEFKYRLDLQVPKGVDALNACFIEELEALKQRQEASAAASASAASASAASAAAAAAASAAKKAKAPWTVKETTTLIKAVKTYPAGTVSRWEKIAEYINLHGIEDGETPGVRERGPEECIKKAKEAQGVTIAERAAMQQAAANAAAAKKLKEVEIKEAPSARGDFGTVVEDAASTAVSKVKAAVAAPKAEKENNKPASSSGFVLPENDSWSAEQQAALEAGLRKYPASQFSANPSERWEKIASEVQGKSKKEVKQRVKDLADAIKKKNKK